MAALSMLHADVARAQRSLTSVLLPTDTTGAKKTNAVPVSPKRTSAEASSFARVQLEHERVFEARFEKRFELKKLFRERGLAYPAAEIFMRVFKREQQLEMWVRPEAQDSFVLLKTYQICALSEKPGPKRTRGDLQTPEGFYFIDNFNPQSGYHLSLRVNYPNRSDRILGGDYDAMGGDIFIHGGCKTAGCMALTDEGIKEVYLLAMEARDGGQLRIPVHIFPARLTDESLHNLVSVFEKQPELVAFWANLKGGFDYFETSHKLPFVSVNKRGRYEFDSQPPESGEKGELLGTPVTGAGSER